MLYEIYFDDETHIATFFDWQDAAEFCQAENDMVECKVLSIEEKPLIDNYGFPCSPKELLC